MKLWIDDIRNAPDDSWTVARSVGAAIRAIAHFGNDIKEISLDHDISHQIGMGALSRPYPCEETFQPVAYYMAEFYDGTKYPKVTIHTSNPEGAVTMKKILESSSIPSTIKLTGAANRLEMEV